MMEKRSMETDSIQENERRAYVPYVAKRKI
jgi:hypothetical protein